MMVTLRHALGARGAHEILIEHLQHAAPRQPGEIGGIKQSQSGGGQDDELRPIPARHWQQPQDYAENQHQHRPEHEGRQANADHRGGHWQIIQPRVALDRSEDARRYPDHQRHQQRNRTQLAATPGNASVMMSVTERLA